MLAEWIFFTIRIPPELWMVLGFVLTVITAFLIRRWHIRRKP